MQEGFVQSQQVTVCRAPLQEFAFLPGLQEKCRLQERALPDPLSLSPGLRGDEQPDPKSTAGERASSWWRTGCSSRDRWARGPKVKVPRVIWVPPPAVDLVTCRIESLGPRLAALCFPTLPDPVSVTQGSETPLPPTPDPLCGGGGWQSMRSLIAQLRRWRSGEGPELGPGPQVLPPRSSPQSCLP